MGIQEFADESKAGGFLLAVVSANDDQVVDARQAVRRWLLPSQRRFHTRKERDVRRKMALDSLAELSLDYAIYLAGTQGREIDRRAWAIGEAARDARALRQEVRLCIERDDSLVARDRQVLHAALGGYGLVRYSHIYASAEPLLWAADVAAWAWSAGGEWRRRVKRLGAREIGPRNVS